MFRLFSVAVAAGLISLPFLTTIASEQEKDAQSEWRSSHSVVSFRGVRVNLVQPPEEPAAEPATPLESAAEPAAVADEDLMAAPEPPAASASDDVAAPVVGPWPLDDCGPLRVRITDVPPATAPVPEEEMAEFAEPPAPPRLTAPDDCGPIRAHIKDVSLPAEPKHDGKSAVAQRGKRAAGGKGGKRAAGGLFGAGGRRGHASGDPYAGGGRGRLRGRAACGHQGDPDHAPGLSCAFCQMYQRYAYIPEMHGYYYHRPYNWTHLAEHQQIAAEWGEDPRNPYANTLFDQVYADYFAENGEVPVEPEPPAVTPEPPEAN